MTKILLVEDEKEIANMIANFLKKRGFEVDVVYNLASAFKVFTKDYSIVILDIMLGDDISFPFLEKMKKESPLTSVIIMTGYDNEENILKAKQLGADAFISKPFEVEYLENLLLSKIYSLQKKQ
ncbi:MAG: response regulator [Candidatus Omnitrophica bacterium]|nr:response regulator [Candidatus Omnitrophota bacterium]MCM8832023.1 response regulator [Candidatus Omnitrophota bacterium]